MEPIYEEAKQKAQQDPMAYVDETSWTEKTDKKWLWVMVTSYVTIYWIAAKRSRECFLNLVGNLTKIIVPDRFSVYKFLEKILRQVCWSHLLRDFQAMIERNNEESKKIGEELLAFGQLMLNKWAKVRDGTMTIVGFRRKYRKFFKEAVREILERGSRCACEKTAATCGELLAMEESLWTFAYYEGMERIEPTNNSSERALRLAVILRKISFGTQSDRGSRYLERMFTIVESCRQQKRNVLDFITQAVSDHRNKSKSKPSLLHYTP